MIKLLMKRPPLIAILCLLGGLSVNSQLSPGPPVSVFFRMLGVLPIVMGFWLLIKTFQTFEQRGTTYKPEETPSILVTDGPMRVSRNPMYLGMAMLLAGIGWLMVSTPVMLSGLVFALIVQKYFILPEEEVLKDLYGDEYMAYRSRVRRWL